MNTPIIDPIFIYWLQILGSLQTGASVVSILSLLGFIIVLIVIFADYMAVYWKYRDEKQKKIIKRILRYILQVFVICFALSTFIPSTDTLIKMYIAGSVTPNTVKTAISTGKDLKNELKKDIIDIIQTIDEEKKK
jgi:membrane-associated HD superfamily phosphohydrolase